MSSGIYFYSNFKFGSVWSTQLYYEIVVLVVSLEFTPFQTDKMYIPHKNPRVLCIGSELHFIDYLRK